MAYALQVSGTGHAGMRLPLPPFGPGEDHCGGQSLHLGQPMCHTLAECHQGETPVSSGHILYLQCNCINKKCNEYKVFETASMNKKCSEYKMAYVFETACTLQLHGAVVNAALSCLCCCPCVMQCCFCNATLFKCCFVVV